MKSKALLRILKRLVLSTANISSIPYKKLPTVMQFPITTMCNSRCVMCDIWQMDYSQDLDLIKIEPHLKSRFFSRIKSVGINGGEPFMKKNIVDYFAAIVSSFDSLKSISLITNGFNAKLIERNMPSIYRICNSSNVDLNLTVSLDGVSETHDIVRGVNGSFQRTVSSIQYLSRNKHYDYFDLACTITLQNIHCITAVIQFANELGVPINLRFASSINRIGSDKLLDNFDTLKTSDISMRQLSSETLHFLMHKTADVHEKFRYYSLFSWLKSGKRLLGCAWQSEGITLNPNGAISHCAVINDPFCQISDNELSSAFSRTHAYQKRINAYNKDCNNCTHDYDGQVQSIKYLSFICFYLTEKLYIYKYYVLSNLTTILLLLRRLHCKAG